MERKKGISATTLKECKQRSRTKAHRKCKPTSIYPALSTRYSEKLDGNVALELLQGGTRPCSNPNAAPEMQTTGETLRVQVWTRRINENELRRPHSLSLTTQKFFSKVSLAFILPDPLRNRKALVLGLSAPILRILTTLISTYLRPSPIARDFPLDDTCPKIPISTQIRTRSGCDDEGQRHLSLRAKRYLLYYFSKIEKAKIETTLSNKGYILALGIGQRHMQNYANYPPTPKLEICVSLLAMSVHGAPSRLLCALGLLLDLTKPGIWGGDIKVRLGEELAKATADSEVIIAVDHMFKAKSIFEGFRTSFFLCPRKTSVSEKEVGEELLKEEPRVAWLLSSNVPLLFPDPLPALTLVDRSKLVRGRYDGDTSDEAGRQLHSLAMKQNFTKQLILGHGGTVITVYNGDLLLVVQSGGFKSAPSPWPSSRAPSLGLTRMDGFRLTDFSGSGLAELGGRSSHGLDRKTTLVRRMIVQAGTLSTLVNILVHGLDDISVAAADDNGEMSLPKGMTRELVVDGTEFARVWWSVFRSFVTPFVFFEVASKRNEVLVTIKEWLTIGGGAQDILDDVQLYHAVEGFLEVLQTTLLSSRQRPKLLLCNEHGSRCWKPIVCGLEDPPNLDRMDPEGFVDNLDGMVSAAFSNVTQEDLYVTADLLEVQNSDRTGWFSLRDVPSVEEVVEIQTVYFHIQEIEPSPLISELTQGALYQLLPPDVRSCIRAYGIIRKWLISKIVAPRIDLRARQARMELLIQAIEVSRLRNTETPSTAQLIDQPCIRSFVETVTTSALLSVESRLHVRAWLGVALGRGSSKARTSSILISAVKPPSARNSEESNRRGFERLNNVEKEVLTLEFDHHGIEDEAAREATSQNAQATQFIDNERSYTFQLDTEDGGHYLLQATTKREMIKWLETISRVTSSAAKRRLTYLGNSPKPQIADHIHHHPIVASRDPKADFGVELEFLLRRETGSDEIPPGTVPRIIEQCLTEVERRGLSQVGIYTYNRGEFPIRDTTDIHAICDLVKSWFCPLPKPVFPPSSYHAVMEAMRQENLDDQLLRIREVVQALPQANFDIIRRVSEHLDKVTDFEEHNHMTTEALTIVFSPNLLRVPQNDFVIILNNMELSHKLVKALITHVHIIFNEADPEAELHSEDELVLDAPILKGEEEEEEEEDKTSYEPMDDSHDNKLPCEQ
ncbi:hypothetical protein GALMADRAFT_208785 [Galerina marginata CBS 339.88]|uniref:Rho-GAP domain-containing protein n=1 Tax=Galerina marginata (strain CBS 339.88) TaxID=685588 RepID=A0A067TAN0_GALM3|nr:hypothetical protein GALMADRAFT_208785 [Galerina marginata CBS 339.88]